MRSVASKFGVADSTVRKVVKEAGGKSLVLLEWHLLSEANIQKRQDLSKTLLNSLKRCGGRVEFFSDEKRFAVDPCHNYCSYCFVNLGSTIQPSSRTVSTPKHPTWGHAFGRRGQHGASSAGHLL